MRTSLDHKELLYQRLPSKGEVELSAEVNYEVNPLFIFESERRRRSGAKR